MPEVTTEVAATITPPPAKVEPAAPVKAAPAATNGKANGTVVEAEVAKPVADTKAAKPATTVVDDTESTAPGWYGEDWREKLAGDDEKELQQLRRFGGVEGLWKKLKNQEKLIRERVTPDKPGEDALPEEVAAYRQSAGLPESVEKMVEGIALADGRVLGDDDKPIALKFAEAAFAEGLPQKGFDNLVGRYFDIVEETKAAEYEEDNRYWKETYDSLMEDWGPAYNENRNRALAVLPEEFRDIVMTARDANGHKLGGNAAVIKWLADLHHNMGMPTPVPVGANAGGASRRAEILAMREKNDPKYWTPEIQAEELKLIDAELRSRGPRSRAA